MLYPLSYRGTLKLWHVSTSKTYVNRTRVVLYLDFLCEISASSALRFTCSVDPLTEQRTQRLRRVNKQKEIALGGDLF